MTWPTDNASVTADGGFPLVVKISTVFGSQEYPSVMLASPPVN